jgi:hypothetical protein
MTLVGHVSRIGTANRCKTLGAGTDFDARLSEVESRSKAPGSRAMRRPRLRFTVRRMMAAVAIAGIVLAFAKSLFSDNRSKLTQGSADFERSHQYTARGARTHYPTRGWGGEKLALPCPRVQPDRIVRRGSPGTTNAQQKLQAAKDPQESDKAVFAAAQAHGTPCNAASRSYEPGSDYSDVRRNAKSCNYLELRPKYRFSVVRRKSSRCKGMKQTSKLGAADYPVVRCKYNNRSCLRLYD